MFVYMYMMAASSKSVVWLIQIMADALRGLFARTKFQLRSWCILLAFKGFERPMEQFPTSHADATTSTCI